jgi:MoaA/NifB/PqqE/SkfB family radical SAM enzyme
MNLLVTDKCTNHCPYCFASTEMGKSNVLNQLSRENIGKIIGFIRNNDTKFDLNIIGGEPFLYKDLSYLINELTNEPNFGKALIFTGGIFRTEKLLEIEPYSDKVCLLFNLNEKIVYKNKKEYELVLKNLGKSIELGIKSNIGINIYRIDFNFIEILNVCNDFGIENLRWTIACPQLGDSHDIKVLYPSDYPNVSKRVMQFLEIAYNMKINAILDCPIPKCFFSLEELGRLALIHPQIITSTNACSPVIDITPDLNLIRCFAFSEIERKKLIDFEKCEDAKAYFNKNIDERFTKPQLYEKCNDCEFGIDRTCLGGCMVNTPQSINKGINVETLIKNTYDAIKEEKYELAEEIIFHIPRIDATVAFLTAHLFYKQKDIKNAKRWAMISINRSKTDKIKQAAIKLLRIINLN